jgi:hypothetical protein
MDLESQEILYEDNQHDLTQLCWSRDGSYLFFRAKRFGLSSGVYSFSHYAMRLEVSSGISEDIFTPAGVEFSETRTELSCSP